MCIRDSRSEENFFESNAEVILMGDRQLTDNCRLGCNVGGNFMYQRSETLGVGVGNMVDKGNWMLNAANLLSLIHIFFLMKRNMPNRDIILFFWIHTG